MTKTPEYIYEDNHLIVVLKKPGILSQAARPGVPDLLSLIREDLKCRYEKKGNVYLGLVHRLDQPVGGLMVLAKTSKAASRLSRQTRDRQLERFYLAVVSGTAGEPGGRLVDHLVKRRHGVEVVAKGEGKEAVLDYLVLARNETEDCSLVFIRLVTGRAHQIRVQFAKRQQPIFGDRRYGPQQPGHQQPAENLPALFACALCLEHPTRKEQLIFTALPQKRPPWTFFQLPLRQELEGFVKNAIAGLDFHGIIGNQEDYPQLKG